MNHADQARWWERVLVLILILMLAVAFYVGIGYGLVSVFHELARALG